MSQRRGLGKGLGALIPPGGVKIPTSGAHGRSRIPAATRTTTEPRPEGMPGSTRDSSVEPPPENTHETAPQDDPVEESRQAPAEGTGDPRMTGIQESADQEIMLPEGKDPQGTDLSLAEEHRDSQESPLVEELIPTERLARPEQLTDQEDSQHPADVTHVEENPQPSSTMEPGGPEGGEFGLIYAEIPIDQIQANPQQPRSVFDEDSLQELASSIKEIGLLQPVVVRGTVDGYELVAGERRLRAAQRVGMGSIPALVRETDDEAMLRDALLENLHRVQLNPLEEAAAYSQLLTDFSCTQEELAGRIGRSRPQISNTLRLLRLPPKVQRRVAAGVLSSGHARALLSFEDEERMEELATRIVAEGLSVRAIEEIALIDSSPGTPRRSRRKRNTPVEYLEAADKLGDLLETRVRIEAGVKHGRVVVEFGDVEDLGRILDLIQTGLEG